MKHEYKVVDIDEIGMNEEMYINLLGNQGWELININNSPGHYHPVNYVKLYFKREFVMNNTKLSRVNWLENFVFKENSNKHFSRK